MFTLATVTLLPIVSPGGLAEVIVMVTVVVVSAAVEIALAVPAQTEGRPLVQSHTSPAGQVAGATGGLECPAGHAGIELVKLKASVAGVYNSALFGAVPARGWPDPAGGVTRLRNELPVEPPTISTWPSSAVPLPSIRVALGPLRAMLIAPPVPAKVNAGVFSLSTSAVCGPLPGTPLAPP